jgi:hypothetical protein
MGKDRTGKYHPPKGKPSGAGKEEGLGIHPTDPDKLDQYLEITDKYTTGADELAPSVPVRHPNRHTSRGEGHYRERSRKPEEPDKATTETFKEEAQRVQPEELPGRITRDIFVELAAYNNAPAITLILPTHRSGVAINEQNDNIAFKNVLQQAEKKLKENKVETDTIRKLLAPGYELLRNEEFWTSLSSGLAVFIGADFFKYVKLPVEHQEKIVVNSSFYLSPLVPLMTSNAYFYLLVISKKQAKLFRVDAFGIQFIDVPEMPNGMDDVVHFEEKDDEKLFRTGSSGAGGGANFHGIGSGKPDDKINISLYLEEVDDTIWKKILHTEHVPLVLAGVEYLIPIYRQVSDYKHVWEEALTGSHEHLDTTTLYEKAVTLMQPFFDQKVNKALELYGNQSATSLTSFDGRAIIPAAHYARVSHLFVARNEHIWGVFDEAANKITLSGDEAPGMEDLVDKAVVKAMASGAEVYFLEKEQMPGNAKMAAIMRY